MTIKILAAAVVTMGLSSTAAFAADCNGTFWNTYHSAKQARYHEVYGAWQARGSDCSYQVEVEGIFQFFGEDGPAIRSCKNQGVNAGTMQALNQIAHYCSTTGKIDGKLDGVSYGVEYCGKNKTFFQLVPGDYEIAYEGNCRDKFTQYVANNCAWVRDADANFWNTVANKCNI